MTNRAALFRRVDVGGGAVMFVPEPAPPGNTLEWQMRYGDAEGYRMQAATLIESFEWLLSPAVSMNEASRRLKKCERLIEANPPPRARPAMSDLKVGDTVWIFDISRRQYERDEKGHSIGGPIYRSHFVPRVIVGEEKRSWLVGWDAHDLRPAKVGKAKNNLLTAKQVDEQCWEHDHRYKIVRKVQHCDVATLRAIARLVGYEVAPATEEGD